MALGRVFGILIVVAVVLFVIFAGAFSTIKDEDEFTMKAYAITYVVCVLALWLLVLGFWGGILLIIG